LEWQPWEAWTAYFGGRYERNTLLADPLFRDPEALDFSLLDASPARDVGFEPIDTSQIGLRADFPFATGSARYDP